MRDAIERLLGLIGFLLTLLAFMALLQQLGVQWHASMQPWLALGELPGSVITHLADIAKLELPAWVAPAVSLYIFFGLYFRWITRTIAQKHTRSMKALGIAHEGYHKTSLQEEAVILLIWPHRLASDIRQGFWQLAPAYVLVGIFLITVIVGLCLLLGLASAG